MRRARAARPEVVGGWDNSAAEVLLPHAVDRDPGREWILGRDEPLGQRHAGVLPLGVGRRQHGGRPGLHGDPGILPATAEVDMRDAGRRGVRHGTGIGYVRRLRPQPQQLVAQRDPLELLPELLGDHAVVVLDEVVLQDCLLSGRSFGAGLADDSLAVVHVLLDGIQGVVPVRPLAGVVGGEDHLCLPSRLEFVDAVLFEEFAPPLQVRRELPQVGAHLPGHGSRDRYLVNAVHECEQTVVVLLGYQVVLVVMALGTAYGQAEPDRADRVRAVDGLLEPELLDVHASLTILEPVAEEADRHALVGGSSGQGVPRDLLQRESVEWHIVVQRVDDPLPPAPSVWADVVLLVAVRVGVAGEVEPLDGPALAVVLRLEQPVHERHVRLRTRVSPERSRDLGLRRQSCEIQTDASRQSTGISRPRRLDSLGFQAPKDKAVDGVPHPSLIQHGRERRLDHGPEGPVVRPIGGRLRWPRVRRPAGALIDPRTENLDLMRIERSAGRRHREVFLQAGHEPEQAACAAVAGDDHRPGVSALQGSMAFIQAEAALLQACPVAYDAIGLEDWSDVLGEVHPARGRRADFGGLRDRGCCRQQQRQDHSCGGGFQTAHAGIRRPTLPTAHATVRGPGRIR